MSALQPESGKGLSTNDFTNEYKDKVDSNDAEISSARGSYATMNERLSGIESEQESQGAALDKDRADLAAETSAREAADSKMQAEIAAKADASELHALLPNITSLTTIQDYANSLSKGVYTAFIANVSNPSDSPINANCFVNIYVYSASTAAVELIPISSIEISRTYTMRKIAGEWRGWYMVEGTPVASSTQSTAALMSEKSTIVPDVMPEE
jgi:hypothetical protein